MIIDDDFDDGFDDGNVTLDLNTTTQNIEQQDNNETFSDSDLISSILKSKGIEDMSKIAIEDEDGEIELFDWNNLSKQERLDILNSNFESNNDLDDDEVEFINAIRNSKMSPKDYVTHMQNLGVQKYLENAQNENRTYQIDNLSDDALFMADIFARVGEDNISDEEVQGMLEAAKQNETLFKKQVDAIRNEYRRIEDNNLKQQQEYEQNKLIEEYNRYAENIEKEIRNLKQIGGYDLDMDESEMKEVYDFITGFDEAGVSIFRKALADPKIIVRMAWYALHGDEAMKIVELQWKNVYKSKTNDQKTAKVEIRKEDNIVDDDDDDF